MELLPPQAVIGTVMAQAETPKNKIWAWKREKHCLSWESRKCMILAAELNPVVMPDLPQLLRTECLARKPVRGETVPELRNRLELQPETGFTLALPRCQV
jgi:hypothetical protein